MINLNQIYNENCVETIKRIPDDYLDLVVTSPPYYTGKEYEDSSIMPDGYDDYFQFIDDVFIALYNKIKPGGHLWINIDDVHTSLKSVYKVNKVLPTHAFLITCLEEFFDYKEMILWRKTRGKVASGGSSRLLGSYGRFGSPGSIPIVQECEYILWFKKSGVRKDVNDDRRKESALTSEEFKEYGMQIWNVQPERAKTIGHPAPFPIEIPSRIIKLSTFKNDIVYDPFMGSGTTAIACKMLGRNYIGSELNSSYIEIINKRLQVLEQFNVEI